MATFTIKTRSEGAKTFFVPDGGGYVRMETRKGHGTLGTQICYGGKLRGNTIECSAEELPEVARKWWRQHMRYMRGEGLR